MLEREVQKPDFGWSLPPGYTNEQEISDYEQEISISLSPDQVDAALARFYPQLPYESEGARITRTDQENDEHTWREEWKQKMIAPGSAFFWFNQDCSECAGDRMHNIHQHEILAVVSRYKQRKEWKRKASRWIAQASDSWDLDQHPF